LGIAMHQNPTLLAAFAASLACMEVAHATALRVEPVLLELNAPAAAASLTLRNDEDADVEVQTRVLRWSQSDGKESLEPTTDVVASPPAVRMAPHSDYVVRVVRVSKQPVNGEESYRVIVDQLPRAGGSQSRSVNLLVRQSIPAFFRGREISRPQVSWSLRTEAGQLTVVTHNAGDERLRIANLRLKDSSGATLSFGNGLLGYVLGHSSMSWATLKYPRGFGSGGSISVTAETDKGQTHAVIESPTRR
jgi:fimbrial chaperone protein